MLKNCFYEIWSNIEISNVKYDFLENLNKYQPEALFTKKNPKSINIRKILPSESLTRNLNINSM